MKEIPTNFNEQERLKALESYSIMDSLPEKDFDSITQLASYICNTPVSLVSLLDKDRQWFKSTVGLEAKETPKAISFCQYAIQGDKVYEVQNAVDNKLFSDNPLVTGNPDIRFYAGAPLKDKEGFNLGTLCVIDTVARALTDIQKNALTLLADQVVNLLELRRKNNNLLLAHEEFKNFFELTRDLVAIANIDGNFYKVNPSFSLTLGYPPEDMEGKPFISFIHPDDIDKTNKEVANLATGVKTISFENRYRKVNGEYVSLSWNVAPDPVTGKLYCIARDVTLINKQKEQLLTTSTDLEAILNATDFSVVSSGLDGVIQKFNRGAEKLLGYKADDVVGKMTPEIFHVKEEVVKRSQEVSKEFGRTVEAGYDTFVFKARQFGVADSNEWTYVKKDGSTFPIRLSVTAIRNAYGELTGYLGIGEDITKQKEAELNLVNSNKLLDESERIAKTGSWKFDLIAKDLFWSKGNYKIFEFEEVPANKLYGLYRKVLSEEDNSSLDEAIEAGVVTGKDFNLLQKIEFPNSRVKYILTLGQVLKNEFGESIGAQGSCQDITEKLLAEQDLINSNKLLDESQDIAKAGSWKFDVITKDLIWSKGNYKTFELEELPANKLFDAYRKLLRPETVGRLDIAIAKSVASGEDFEFLTDIKFADNRIKYILTLGKLVKNEFGEVIAAQGSTQDITDKMLAEQSLIRSNNLLDESQSIAKIGSWKFNISRKEVAMSKGHSKIFELDDVPTDQLYSAYRGRIHHDDLIKLDILDENTIKTGQEYETNYRILLPDNRIKYISEIGQAYKDEKGEVVGLQGSVMDVTEKTLVEQKLAEKAKEVNDIRLALDESAIITIVDNKGLITFVNDQFCSVSKYSKEEIIGQYSYIDNKNYKLSKFRENIFRTIQNGEIWKGEIKNIAKDGSFYWEKTTIVPFLDTKGKIYQYIAISADISEQKTAQENLNHALIDLEKKNKELDQFAYVVSHDLKAPLRAIHNLAEWIVEDMPELPTIVNDNFGLLRGRVQRMENLINGVLDYSRIGRTKVKTELIDVKEMIDEVTETLILKNDFEISISGNFPIIMGAPILLNQVFSNLIGNAIKYNDKPIGKVVCFYESIPGFHQFSIKDNGPGIAEEYHKKVFQVFQTIEARDKKESTGIGLSIVLKIIEESGGSIKIESEERKGTNFIFTLPKVKNKKAARK
jgi:PAS domain S-box-containing protein